MVVMAHPDDAELTCDGAIARWVQDGDRAILAVATSGSPGVGEMNAVAAAASERRMEEQRAAAGLVGYEKVIFLGFADGDVREEALLPALVELVRTTRPDAVIVMDPTTVIYRDRYINHRDHRALGMAMLDAMYPRASNAGYYPEQLARGLTTYKVPEVLLAQSDRPNFWVDVSDSLEQRFMALRRHRSQTSLWPDNGEAIVEEQREQARLAGLRHGVRYAEEYRRILPSPLN